MLHIYIHFFSVRNKIHGTSNKYIKKNYVIRCTLFEIYKVLQGPLQPRGIILLLCTRDCTDGWGGGEEVLPDAIREGWEGGGGGRGR